MSIKLPNLRKQTHIMTIIWALLLFASSTLNTYGQTGNTQSNPIVVGTFSTAFSYSNSQNTSNFTNNYTKRTPNDVYYKFTLNKKMEVTISHCGSTLSDTYVSLLDASGTLIDYNDDYAGTGACSSSLHSYLKKELDAGTYYVVSEGFSQNGIILTQISGIVINLPGDSMQDPIIAGTYDNSFEYSNTQNTTNFTNQYTARTPNDVFYKFTLSRKMKVTMSHCGSLIDTYMFLLDASGNTITSNDDYSGDGACTTSLHSFIQKTLDPGTYYIVSEAFAGTGIITTNISGYAPEDFNYPDIPNNYSSEPETVGSSGGKLNSSSTGGAIYSIPIDVPLGVSGMQPSFAIVYNSQSGNGMAGWGCNLSGISVITRAPKDIYHDDIAKGLTHLADEAYLLDGQRLIYVSGTVGQEGAVYSPETDPFTKVIVHGTYNTTTANTWFEVQSSNGMIYYYGDTFSARQSYTYNGFPRINAWYIDYAEDPLGNNMIYSYNNTNNVIYPSTVAYGNNKNRANSLQNTVTFNYENREDNGLSYVLEENVKASIIYRLKNITSKTGSNIFRSYELQYDATSDGSYTKFSRLTNVTVKNGAGEALKPIKLNWSFLPSFSQSVNQPTIDSALFYPHAEFSDQQYIQADLNGDGLTDIVGISPVEVSSGQNSVDSDTYAYVYWASLDANGNVQYTKGSDYSLGANLYMKDLTEQKEGCYVLDFDGDGINDLLMPNLQILENPDFSTVEFKFVGGTMNKQLIGYNLKHSNEMPCYTSGDFNNDGKSDIILMEKKLSIMDQLQNPFKYPCVIFGLDQSKTVHSTSFEFTFLSNPEKMFVSDFNSDGLTDVLVFYDGGYSIFWNQGNGISTSTFSDSKKTTGANIGNASMIRPGDFNGDGLLDFLMNSKGDNKWYFAQNNGDGTFTKTLACTLDIYEQDFTNKDDNRFDCLVYDFDFDGKSDVVINKAMYTKKSDLVSTWGEFNKTYTYWMRSTGNALTQVSMATSNRDTDGLSSHYMLGDFNGDGQPELMNYGYNCYNSTNADNDPLWRLYQNTGFNADRGKVISVTDSYGGTTSITYASFVNGGLYTKGTGSTYPMADCTLPIHAVKTVTTNIGATGSATTSYQYSGMKVHLQGKGLLGMTSQTATNTTLGTVTESGVKAWNTLFYTPAQTYTKIIVDGATAETNVTLTIADKGSKNYFTYPSSKTDKDLDGNTVTTSYQVNATYGYPEEETINYGSSMYKTIRYGNYAWVGNSYKPQLITQLQKHQDDASIFTKKTAITYENNGCKKQVIENYESSRPLTTNYTNDEYGNVLTSVTSGQGIKPIFKYTDYDATKRFIAKTYTSPASLVNTFTYDDWGNVLTEKDESNPLYSLATFHVYDNWGNRILTFLPDGRKKVYSSGWNNKLDKRYFTLVQGTGQPWVKTWYDNHGREVLVESIGEKGLSIQNATVYNAKGETVQKQSQTGNLITTDNFVYDGRGRISIQNNSAGQSTSYSYGNRTVSTTTNGRTSTQIYDPWGGLKSVTDPVATITYAYTSLGKPKTVITEGAAFSMTYDDTGIQRTLTDPNAGTTTYDYDAAGRITRQEDSRGKVTINKYDDLGRLDTLIVDTTVTVYNYGKSGCELLQLVKKQTGDNYLEYSYDTYGHIISENRQIAGMGMLTFAYTYNALGQLSKITYPGNLAINRQYDACGNLEKVSSDTQSIWELTGSSGTVTTARLGGTLTATETHNSQGLLTNLKTVKDSEVLHNMDFIFDGATGNLTSRSGMLDQAESFTYDNLDRLTYVKEGSADVMQMGYSTNGNISSKTGVGAYTYFESKPHAVVGVENTGNLISKSTQSTIFNEFGKIKSISDAGSGYRLDFIYGPDQERWKTVLKQNGNIVKTTIFADDYEQVIKNGTIYRLYYLDGGALYVKQDGKDDKVYYACTDHLESIVKLVDVDGTEVFSASYDAWGKRTVTNNTFDFHRGYTGHEHLPEFDLINMNGRLYDPILGRFLSPDQFVQMPDLSQNFNRYSYCLNNPLKYTDPSGELFGIDDMIIFTVLNAIIGGAQADINGGNWGDGALKGAAIGAAISTAGAAVSFGVGQLFGHEVGSLGTELLRAGTHGVGNGLINLAQGENFGSGFITGAAASLAGSAGQDLGFGTPGVVGTTMAVGSVASALSGGDWFNGATQGMNIGLFNHTWDGEKPINADNPILLKEVVVTGHRISNSMQGAMIAATAFSYVKRDSRNYGMDNDPRHIDCSRLTLEVAAKCGYKLPRTSTGQMEWFKKYGYWSDDFSNARSGDHIFWSHPNHTGVVYFDESGNPGAINATVNGNKPFCIKLTRLDSNGNLLPRRCWPHHFIGIGRFK